MIDGPRSDPLGLKDSRGKPVGPVELYSFPHWARKGLREFPLSALD